MLCNFCDSQKLCDTDTDTILAQLTEEWQVHPDQSTSHAMDPSVTAVKCCIRE